MSMTNFHYPPFVPIFVLLFFISMLIYMLLNLVPGGHSICWR